MNRDTPANRLSQTESADLQAGHRYACALTRDAEAAERLVTDAWLKLARDTRVASANAPTCQPRRIALFKAIRSNFDEQLRWQGDSPARKTLFPHCKDLEVVELETIFLTTVEGLSAGQVSAFTSSPIGRVRDLLASGRAKLTRSFQGRLKNTCN